MKKIYIIPTTSVIKVETVHMIAESGPEGFNGELDTNGGDGSAALGRRGGDFWDDED